MDSLFLLTQNTNALFKPIAKVLGLIMNGIYVILDDFLNIQNIALTIIIFTVIIYIILLPLTYQQQKFTKMSQIMNPEIQAIQKKYRSRKDSASMQAMQEETQAVYKKYGVNPQGSCIFMVIQLLILFPLYRVIYNVPAYVTRVKETFADVVNNIMGTSGYESTMTDFLSTISENNSVLKNVSLNFDGTTTEAYDSIIDVLYKCTSDNWQLLAEKFSGFSDIITSTQATVEHFNSFLTVNIVYSPKTLIGTNFQAGYVIPIIIAILIPVLSAATQFLNVILMNQRNNNNNSQQDAMASQMKMMNYFMPIYSFFIVFFLPVGVGIYWIAGAVIRLVQMVVINRRLERIDLAELVEKNAKKNEEKNKKKIEKKGVSGDKIANAARINTRQIDTNTTKKKTMSEKAASVSKASSADTSKQHYKEGSMAALANKVREYNEKNSR